MLKNLLFAGSFLAISALPVLAMPTPRQQLATWVNLKAFEGTCSLSKNQAQFIQVYGINAKQSWDRSGLGTNEMNAIIQKTTSNISEMYGDLKANEGQAAAQMIFCNASDKLINKLIRDN